ncbi:Uncharacterised protein [Mycobacteroides abscessus subsp. abscessus]|nr:Uncharacterised protein [Mycobacteroides abscessus subsp. abscessus]
MAVPTHLIQEYQLIRKDVRRIVVIVVEVPEFGVEEARRSRRRDDPGGADLGDVLTAPVHLALAFLGAKGLLGAGGHVVDHRVPDGSRVLQHVHVDVPELFGQYVQIDRTGIVHVESRRGAVGHHKPGIADGPIGRGPQRDDHDVEVALGATHPMLHRVFGLHEGVKSQSLQLPSQIGHRIVRQ